ncbi:MAG: pyridoxine 5'-phosphate synthase [Planctomycetaceae bacterium]
MLPQQCTLVPEKREEITTEGGLDVVGQRERVARCVDRLLAAGLEVSLFIDPDERQIDASKALGAHAVELHTGRYADATTAADRERELLQSATVRPSSGACCSTWATDLRNATSCRSPASRMSAN